MMKPAKSINSKPLAKSQALSHASAPGKLRIIGGVFKRTPLPIANVEGLRPTPDRLRETLFNWLGGDLTGLRCLDLFAGTGALGFEAASRGASFVLLNEMNRTAAAQLQKSRSLLLSRQGAESMQIEVQTQDAIHLLKSWQGAPFDVVFIDPPFAQEALYLKAFSLLGQENRAQAAIYLEAKREWTNAELAPYGLQMSKRSKVGAVHGHLLSVINAQGQ